MLSQMSGLIRKHILKSVPLEQAKTRDNTRNATFDVAEHQHRNNLFVVGLLASILPTNADDPILET